MIKEFETLGAVHTHTHTHTHTEHSLKNDFCFFTCKLGVASLDFCTQILIEFIGRLAF